MRNEPDMVQVSLWLSAHCLCTDLGRSTDNRASEARVERNYLDLKYFLLAMNWLYRYDMDEELSATFGHCSKTLRKWKWFYVGKIAALKEQKVERYTLKGRGGVNLRVCSRLFLCHLHRLSGPIAGIRTIQISTQMKSFSLL